MAGVENALPPLGCPAVVKMVLALGRTVAMGINASILDTRRDTFRCR